MEIEGFGEVSGIIALAKKLHDIGRYDIVQNQFLDTLCCDCWFEDMIGAISSIFSGFYNDYDDGSETETMIFTDDCLSEYYRFAWEFGKNTNTPHDKNPYVIEAKNEVSRQLSFCYSMDWKLLGYTKTKRTAGQSKLIIYVGVCECDCHTNLAFGLVQLYEWFSGKCTEFRKKKCSAEEVIAA